MYGNFAVFEYFLPFIKEKMKVWILIGFFLICFFYSYYISPLGFQASIYRIRETINAIESINSIFLIPVLTFLIFYDNLSSDEDKEYLKSKPFARIKIFAIRWAAGLSIAFAIFLLLFFITLIEKIVFEMNLPEGKFVLVSIKHIILKPLFYTSIFSFVVMFLGILVQNEFFIFLISTGIWIISKKNVFLIIGAIGIFLMAKFSFQKMQIRKISDKIPCTFVFIVFILILVSRFVKFLKIDSTMLFYILFEIVLPYIFSFICFGIFSIEKKNNLLERMVTIPGSLIYIFKERLRRAMVIWVILCIASLFLFQPIIRMNGYHLMMLCLTSNFLFWSGIYILLIGLEEFFGVLVSFLIFISWLLPRVQRLIGNFSVYKYLNPFYLTYYHPLSGYLEKLTVGLIGVCLYFLGYMAIKRMAFINLENFKQRR